MKGAIYTCRRCGRAVAATTFDPVIALSSGPYHATCALDMAREKDDERAARKLATTERRRELGRALAARRSDAAGVKEAPVDTRTLPLFAEVSS